MIVADKDTLKALNTLSRKEMIHRLLADISMDINICNIEGWDYKEYVIELKHEIDRIVRRFKCEN